MTSIVRLNVGGIMHITTKQTLLHPGSFFEMMFSQNMKPGTEVDGALFLDRDGQLFSYVLGYLRNPDLWCPPSDSNIIGRLISEADYYCLSGMLAILTDLIPEQFEIIFNTGRFNFCHMNGASPEVIEIYNKYYDAEGKAIKSVQPSSGDSSDCSDCSCSSDSSDSEDESNYYDPALSKSDRKFLDEVCALVCPQYDKNHRKIQNRIKKVIFTFSSTLESNVRARLINIMAQKAELEEKSLTRDEPKVQPKDNKEKDVKKCNRGKKGNPGPT
jgi:BTB/POZ domain